MRTTRWASSADRGLVEEQHLGLQHKGTRERHALRLAAGNHRDGAVSEFPDSQPLQPFMRLPVALGGRHSGHLEAKGDIAENVEEGKQRQVLPDERHVAFPRLAMGDARAVEFDVAGGGRLEPRQHPQSGRLAAATRPHQRDEGTLLDVERKAIDCREVAVSLRRGVETDKAVLIVGHAMIRHQAESSFGLSRVRFLSSRTCASTTRRMEIVKVKLPMTLMRGLA
jgi:hypothetical protein